MSGLSIADKHRLRQLMIGILLLLFIVGGWFYPPIGYFLVVCMLGAMGVGIFKGRNWCDWLCPGGVFGIVT